MKNFIIILIILTNTFISFSQSNTLLSDRDPGEIMWHHYVTGSSIDCTSPVLTSNENILWIKHPWAGASGSDIYCFTPDGDTIWTEHYSEYLDFSPTVIPQLAWIIITGSGNSIHCLNEDGSERWDYTTSEEMTQSAVVDTAFNIYVAAGSKLISIDSSGVLRWEYYLTNGEISTPLTVSKAGVIYFGTDWDKLIAVQNTGNEIFINDLFGYTRGAPSIDFDGTIFMSTSDVSINKSKIEVFNPDGSFVWEMTFNEPNPSAVIIGDSNYIYVRTINFWGGGFGNLYKIDKTSHNTIWEFPYGPNVGGAWDPTINQDGITYITTTSRYYAIDNNGQIIWELDPEAATGLEMSPMSHMVIGSNGNIYSISKKDTDTVYLIAIEEPDAIIANSAWPMHKHDQYSTSMASDSVSNQPNIFIDQLLIDFGFIEVGDTSATVLTVHNIGNLALELDWILDSDAFSMEYDDVRAINLLDTIEAGDSIVYNVIFHSQDAAIFTDTIFFTTNDPDQPLEEVILKGKTTREGEIMWKVKLNDFNLSAPVLDDYGNVYVSNFYELWQISPLGEIKWKCDFDSKTSRSDRLSVSVSNDNSSVFLPRGGTIASVDSSGIVQWIYDPPYNNGSSTIAINEAGDLFFSETAYDNSGSLYCIDKYGNEIWDYYTGFSSFYGPAINQNGDILNQGMLGNQGIVYSVNSSGELNWENNFFPTAPVSIGFDNMVLLGGRWGGFGNYTPRVKSYNQNGDLNWEYFLTNETSTISSSIISHPNESLIFASNDNSLDYGTITALDTSGAFLWDKQFNSRIYSSPAIADNGLIYFSCFNGEFCALNHDGTEKWLLNTESNLSTSPAIDKNGIIYFTTEEGDLFAVYGENGGLANSPWPMLEHDYKHSSSIDTLSVFIDEKEISSVGLSEISAMPNPFNDKTIIKWTLNYTGVVRLLIYDCFGSEIISRKLSCEKGINQFVWDGEGINSGVYIFNISTGNNSSSIKLIKR